MSPRIGIKSAALLFVAGTIGSLFVGMLWSGAQVFDIEQTAAAFLFNGLGCALVFALDRWHGMWGAMGTSVVLSVAFGVFAGDYFVPVFIYSLLMMFASVCVSEYMWGKTFPKLQFGRFLNTAIVFAAVALLTTLIAVVMQSVPLLGGLLVRNTFQGFLIGVGLGLGLEAAEMFIPEREEIEAAEDSAVSSPTP
jgi:hypothetical protein